MSIHGSSSTFTLSSLWGFYENSSLSTGGIILTRLTVVELLLSALETSEKPLTALELSDRTGIAKDVISRRFRTLKGYGMVSTNQIQVSYLPKPVLEYTRTDKPLSEVYRKLFSQKRVHLIDKVYQLLKQNPHRSFTASEIAYHSNLKKGQAQSFASYLVRIKFASKQGGPKLASYSLLED